MDKFKEKVNAQIELLRAGKPMEAFETFFAEEGCMFDNDKLFGKNKSECRSKQESFINACDSIQGDIQNVFVNPEEFVCAFLNKTRFTHPQAGAGEINGLHVQHWKNGEITKEYYYQGDMLESKSRQWLTQD